jgi:hypothetical protein
LAARSIAELLPRPFDQLEVEDVATIVAGGGDERESLVLELKGELRRDLVVKSCAAFANTIGGLLIVGVPDDSDELRGIDDDIGEVQLWVKDVLRARVLPLPPFRARRIDLQNGRWLLLIVVEESSTTPHLLTGQGAIYVRNPGSSDPRPLGDQGLLLDLLHRGERARDLAIARAREVAATATTFDRWRFEGPRRQLSLALASTGVSAWFEDRLLRETLGRAALASVLPDDPGPNASGVHYEWQQHALTAYRPIGGHQVGPDRIEIVQVQRAGVALIRTGFIGELTEWNEAHENNLEREELTRWLRRVLDAGRTLLLELGAHGDLRLTVIIGAPRRIGWRATQWPDIKEEISVELWTQLDLDDERAAEVVSRVEDEIGRALGLGPDAWSLGA